MAEITNSELLKRLMEYASKYGDNEDGSFTAERYLVTVVDVLTGLTQIEISDEQRIKLYELMRNSFPSDALFGKLKSSLVEHIKNGNAPSYLDSIYIQQQMFKAKQTAEKEELDEIGPDILLDCILNDPTDVIKPLIETSASSKKKIDAEELIEKSCRKMAEEEKAEPKKEPEAEPETQHELFKEDPKETVARLTQTVKSIHDNLSKIIFGQDNAISVFTSGYFQAELNALTNKNRTRPGATFLFAGPPGVGKTFLAESAAKELGLPYRRFDMSEYSDKEANFEFCGTDKVYKNGQPGNVTSFVAKNPKCFILFDEIEKAHLNIIHLFLQILDAGRIRDNYTDEEVSFKDAILVFTTNAGRKLYEESETTDYSGMSRKVILKALRSDINPNTGTSYFPAAICSRFASGNVVMFNHITAHNLREIAKKEVLKHAVNFEKEIGIKVRIDEPVYTSLLFAEGGAADARTIKSRAETFFDDEIFELFRLISSKETDTGIADLKSVHFKVELPKGEIAELFERSESYEVLVFSDKKVAEKCSAFSPDTRFINAQSDEEAKKIVKERDISFVLIDMSYGETGKSKYLNAEDIDSKARDFFWNIKELYPEIPIYILQTESRTLASEEIISFTRNGVRGVMTLSEDKFAEEIKDTNDKIYQQSSMNALARANKLVTYETAQQLKNNGKTAEIKLFDFEMDVAVDAEDSKNILSNVSKPDISFDSVIGAEDAKKELRYFVEYLKNPKKYMETGLSAPKGVLLYGPPGTGKTMLAKAMASESDVTFVNAEGNEFINKYWGVGRDRVKELFRTARKYAPAIIFIDEIDAIAKARTGSEDRSDQENTLTAFLTEMDGFKNDNSRPVFILAATNFDVDSLDPALMRRFDRRLYVDLPTKDERLRYIRMKLAERNAFALSEEEIGNIAIRSTGMSLADLASIFELSMRMCIRDGNLKVTDEIFEEAFETYNGGEEKKWDESLLERTARHEAGHAFLYWQNGDTPSYVTIVARGHHGGYMQHDDNEGKAVHTRDELLSLIRTALGGRASEIVYYGDKEGITTGASGDLEHATRIARYMVCTYGMDDGLGLAVIDRTDEANTALAGEVRRAMNAILDQEMKNAVRIISENRDKIDALVERLLLENHLTGDEIKKVFEGK